MLPRADVLTDDEVIRLVRLAVERLGVRERSGSPAANRCCAKAWSTSLPPTAALRPRPSISLTTNAWGLTRLAGRWPRPASTASTSRSTTLDPVVSRR